MLHTCVQRFDVTRNIEKFCKMKCNHLSREAVYHVQYHHLSRLQAAVGVGCIALRTGHVVMRWRRGQPAAVRAGGMI